MVYFSFKDRNVSKILFYSCRHQLLSKHQLLPNSKKLKQDETIQLVNVRGFGYKLIC